MPSVQRRLQALFADQPGSSEHRIRTKSGEVRWLRDYSRAEWDPTHSRIVRIIGAGQDITARKEAEATSLRLAAIVESSDDAIISKSLDGIITSWNAAAERLFGYRAEEIMGRSILRLIPEDRHAEEDELLARLRRGEQVVAFETARRTKDGRRLDVSLTISPLRNEQGTIVGASKILRDITARKHAEGERARLFADVQRVNAELQQFAYTVSHDLNQPLRTITYFTTMLAQHYPDTLDAEADEYLTFIRNGAQRLQQMLADLLAYTRLGGAVPQVTAVDCEALLAQVLSDLRLAIKESQAAITHGPLPTVAGDATRLTQVLQNLLDNALKFRGAAPARVHLAARRTESGWEFAVRDQGIGLDPAQSERIFQVFQRLHPRSAYPGTGMGLAICKRIIEQYGGRLWVDSRPGAGATFYFTLGQAPQHVDGTGSPKRGL
jgi:PAS domain S-box-containing protein